MSFACVPFAPHEQQHRRRAVPPEVEAVAGPKDHRGFLHDHGHGGTASRRHSGKRRDPRIGVPWRDPVCNDPMRKGRSPAGPAITNRGTWWWNRRTYVRSLRTHCEQAPNHLSPPGEPAGSTNEAGAVRGGVPAAIPGPTVTTCWTDSPSSADLQAIDSGPFSRRQRPTARTGKVGHSAWRSGRFRSPRQCVRTTATAVPLDALPGPPTAAAGSDKRPFRQPALLMLTILPATQGHVRTS